MERQKLTISYDRDSDTAYITIGQPRQSVTEEITEKVFVKKDPKTKEVLGLTIVNFSDRFKKIKKIEIELPSR